MAVSFPLISAGSAGKADVETFFKEHLYEIDKNFAVHSAELDDPVVPCHFNAFDFEMMVSYFFTWFNLNQSQSGAASSKSHINNTIDLCFCARFGSHILERLLCFCCNLDHISPYVEFSTI
jgi:hypothetical protein